MMNPEDNVYDEIATELNEFYHQYNKDCGIIIKSDDLIIIETKLAIQEETSNFSDVRVKSFTDVFLKAKNDE